MKTYTELVRFPSFIERFNYLRVDQRIGAETFGVDRWINQQFYRSNRWKRARRDAIIRDEGRDLGVEGYESNHLVVHHMNPITMQQIMDDDPVLYDLEYLITVSNQTHQAIHYGDSTILPELPIERTRWDTCPWRK